MSRGWRWFGTNDRIHICRLVDIMSIKSVLRIDDLLTGASLSGACGPEAGGELLRSDDTHDAGFIIDRFSAPAGFFAFACLSSSEYVKTESRETYL